MTVTVYRTSEDSRKGIAYIRVSTAEQAEQGLSLDAQTARIAAYCAAMGWPVSEVIRDAGASAKSPQRPGIAALLERVRGGEIERIVVAKLDRLTRSVRGLCALVELCVEHDVALVSASESLDTSSAAGRMVVHMLGVVAQWEREAIAERTREALAAKKRRGEPVGRRPAMKRTISMADILDIGARIASRQETRNILTTDPLEAALLKIIANCDDIDARPQKLRETLAELEREF
jgi:DNA invertase Pin-like site-specific DNA recombinase